MNRTTSQWREFLTCLAAMIFYALGSGAFLLLIVGYLEKRGVVVTEIGSVMSLHAVVEGIVCLLVGHFYHGKGTRAWIILGIFLNGLGSLILSFQPLGMPVLAAAISAGAGFGVVAVVMYVAALQRRPSSLDLGLAVGLYTACIAGGNGLGSLACGWVTDRFGFTVSFTISVVCYLLSILCVASLSRQPAAQNEPQPEGQTATRREAPEKNILWMIAMLTAFTLASVNVVFDILFPVYMLRAGMTFTLVGSLSGAKMVLAAIVRPFWGALMARVNPLRLNNWSLVGMVAGTVLIPVAGLGVGLTAVISLAGVTFGSCRTTSATLAIKDQVDPRVVSRRSSYYNTCLTIGQTLTPWITGLVADQVDVSFALMIIPLSFLCFFWMASLAVPRIAARFRQADEMRTYTL